MSALSRVFALSLVLATACKVASKTALKDDEGLRSDAATTESAASDCPVVDMTQDGGLTGALLNGTPRFAALSDPVAKFLLKGRRCPTSGLGEVQRALTKALPKNCGVEQIVTEMVSETINQSAGSKTPDTNFRAVVRRFCGTDPSMPGVLILLKDDKLTAKVTKAEIESLKIELIAFQALPAGSGVFNYYSLENLDPATPDGPKKWHYFGSSQDFIANQSEKNTFLNPNDPATAVPRHQFDGSGNGKFPNQVRRCALCHVNGGLLIKELIEVWPHWDAGLGAIKKEGVAFAAKDPEILGAPRLTRGRLRDNAGLNVQNAVEQGNAAYADNTFDFMIDGKFFAPPSPPSPPNPPSMAPSLSRTLRPLFCDNETNLEGHAARAIDRFLFPLPIWNPDAGDAAADNMLGRALFEKMVPIATPVDGMYDPTLNAPSDEFAIGISKNWKILASAQKATLNGLPTGKWVGGSVIGHDTSATTDQQMFAVGSATDHLLIDRAIKSTLIDAHYVQAALMIDPATPVLSARRCNLWRKIQPSLDKLVPEDSVGEVAKASIAALTAGGEPAPDSDEGLFVAGLREDPKVFAEKSVASITRFLSACARRNRNDTTAYAHDWLALFSLNRSRASKQDLIEFSATMPTDDLEPAPDAHLDFKTCELVCAGKNGSVATGEACSKIRNEKF